MMRAQVMRMAVIVTSLVIVFAVITQTQQKQTLAPHELGNSDAPPPIIWETPPLPAHHLNLESADERRLRVSVVTRHLEQPWSIAFLPDGAMMVTERAGPPSNHSGRALVARTHLERIVFNDRWEELRRESLLTELKQRLRDVRQGPDGNLYVLTAEDDGALLRIEPR
jgi:glucose/arabinose dehydrogenase